MVTTTVWALIAVSALGADPEAGRAVYQAKCQACHGPEGDGQGPAARALPKKPRDMTQPEFWAEFDDERIRQTITNGKPGTAMRAFPMKPDQIADLIAFLHGFEPV